MLDEILKLKEQGRLVARRPGNPGGAGDEASASGMGSRPRPLKIVIIVNVRRCRCSDQGTRQQPSTSSGVIE